MKECEFCDEEFEDEQDLHAHWKEHEEELNSHQKDKMKKAKREIEEKQKQKKEKRKKQLMYGVAGALILGIGVLVGPQMLSEVTGGQSEYNISTEGQPIIGNENASVTVIEFGDYSCGYCRNFEMTTYPQLKENYIDTGQVRFSYINLAFLGADSQRAAEASECVYRQDEEQFWDFHKGIFDNQGSEQGWASQGLLMDVARETTEGLDYEQLRSCISSGETSDQVREERAIANTNGVDSTPTLFVNGEIVEGNDYDSLSSSIERQLE